MVELSALLRLQAAGRAASAARSATPRMACFSISAASAFKSSRSTSAAAVASGDPGPRASARALRSASRASDLKRESVALFERLLPTMMLARTASSSAAAFALQ
eukprot:scaffold60242_cov51-Phaeocystis_antarctica.AAC.1